MNANQLRMLQQLMQAQQQSDEGLVHFKAGRMEFDEITRMVTADKKPGVVKLVRSDEGEIRFQWQNRISGNIDLDVMLLPNTGIFEKVNECTDGRVFVLRMLQSGMRHFFWMQEGSDEKDKEYLENVNKLCRGEPLAGENSNSTNSNSTSGGGIGGGSGLSFEQQLQQAVLQSFQGGANASGGGDVNPFLRALQGQGGNNNRRPAGASAGSSSSSNNNNNSGNKPPSTQTNQQPTPQPSQQQQQQQQLAQLVAKAMEQQNKQREMVEKLKKEPDLTDILNPDETVNSEIKDVILHDEKVCEELAQHLPEDMRSREDILEHINSPQFRSSLQRLQEVINSPNLSTILAQLGLRTESEMDMGVTAFIQAIIKKHGNNNQNP